MPEAVIVATARSPIGRAVKGSLATMRPDDLAAQMVRAALDKVPSLDPRDVDDLMMGCAQPAGEAGYNIARAVAVELGYDFMPGTTVNRYCSSSLQTTRMAFHAIKAGEGDVFISAGVETVSRFGVGSADGAPNSKNPLFAEAQARTAKQAEGADEWHDPATTATSRTSTSPWARPPRTSRCTPASAARIRTAGVCAARTAPRRPSRAGSSRARSPR